MTWPVAPLRRRPRSWVRATPANGTSRSRSRSARWSETDASPRASSPGGFAYRIFLWLLPLGLLLGGALGLSNAESTEDAVDNGGLPGAITNAVGDAARSADSESWWLFAVGVPLLLWAGFTGAKAILLIHSLVWDEPPPRPKPLRASLAFTGVMCAVMGHRRPHVVGS